MGTRKWQPRRAYIGERCSECSSKLTRWNDEEGGEVCIKQTEPIEALFCMECFDQEAGVWDDDRPNDVARSLPAELSADDTVYAAFRAPASGDGPLRMVRGLRATTLTVLQADESPPSDGAVRGEVACAVQADGFTDEQLKELGKAMAEPGVYASPLWSPPIMRKP